MIPEAVVQFEAVSKDYQTGWLGRATTAALRGATFHVRPGEAWGIVGPNRAGKTTLVKLLLGLCRPTQGQVWRFGAPAADRRTLARVGYVHETQAFPRYMRAVDLLHYHGAMALLPQAEVEKRVPELLARVGLADRAEDRVSAFSKGMTQRLALAIALLGRCELLVFDEPVEGLDQGGRLLLRDLLAAHKAAGGTVLMVSHLFAEVDRVCDNLLVLAGGQLLYAGPVARLTRPGGAGQTLEEALEGLYKEPVQWTPPPSSTPPAG